VQQTPLFAAHQQDGAELEPIHDWLLPRVFAGVEVEVAAARSGAVVVDLSHLGKVTLAGPDARRFANGMFTNNITRLAAGQGNRSAMCDDRGRVQGLLDLYCTGEQSFFGVLDGVTPAWFEARYEKFIVFDDVEMQVIDKGPWILSIQGPRAGEIVAALGLPVPANDHDHAGDGGIIVREENVPGSTGRSGGRLGPDAITGGFVSASTIAFVASTIFGGSTSSTTTAFLASTTGVRVTFRGSTIGGASTTGALRSSTIGARAAGLRGGFRSRYAMPPTIASVARQQHPLPRSRMIPPIALTLSTAPTYAMPVSLGKCRSGSRASSSEGSARTSCSAGPSTTVVRFCWRASPRALASRRRRSTARRSSDRRRGRWHSLPVR
jgi:hypothetical protein